MRDDRSLSLIQELEFHITVIRYEIGDEVELMNKHIRIIGRALGTSATDSWPRLPESALEDEGELDSRERDYLEYEQCSQG
jgi:hypothetical protein